MMNGQDYAVKMKNLAQQLHINKVIDEPMMLLGAMSFVSIEERDIDMMTMVMKSKCARTLLRQIKSMTGSAQDYQNQMALLEREAFLGKEPAHRVLVGLWAMVDKDAERASGKTVVEEQEVKKSGVWGHSILYYACMIFAEKMLFDAIGQMGSQMYWLREIYFSDMSDEIFRAVIAVVLAHIVDNRKNYRLSRLKTTLFTAKNVLAEGAPEWGVYKVKLVMWIATLVPAYYNYIILGGKSTLVSCLAFAAMVTDMVFDHKVHQYLNRIGETLDSVR